MRREFTWLNGLLWSVSVIGYAIFLVGLIFFIWGLNQFSVNPGDSVSVMDLVLIGFIAFFGLIIGTIMQAFRVMVSLNDKAVKIQEQMELMDVRIRSVVPQNRQLKQLDTLPDLIEVGREILEKMKTIKNVQGEVQKAMESYSLENGPVNPKADKGMASKNDPIALLQDDSKWKCPHCSAENPSYLFKCRECGRENTTIKSPAI